MASQTVAQFILGRLADHGVRRIYGYPGDGINGLLGAFHEVGERLEFTQCRHEEIAAFAACGHAKLSGEVGVCMATSGPGAIHLLNGLYDAKLDHVPVVAIVGQTARSAMGGSYQQEVDLQALFKDVASEYLVEVADRLQTGVAKALNGRAALPDDLPYVTGSVGLLGTKPSADMLAKCDTFLMIGSSFPYSEWLPEEGQARGVQIDIDATKIGIRYPMEVGLVGDAAPTLRELLPQLEQKRDSSWRQEIEANVERWWRILDERAMQTADPLNPQRVFFELSRRLPDGAILTADSGSATNWWARQLRLRSGMKAALSGTLATMCPAVPYALAAKFAYPDRPVIASVGDGAMQMLGNNALVDIAHYYRRWSDPRCVIVILHNNDLNQVTWEQRVMSGDPKLDASQVLPDFDYAGYARLLGLDGVRVDAPEQVGEALEHALSAERPAVVEAITDPEVPPLPPHIRFDQAKKLSQAVLKGDPARKEIVTQSTKGKLAELLTR